MLRWDLENTSHFGAFILCFQSLWTSPSYFINASLYPLLLGKNIKHLFFALMKAAVPNNPLETENSTGRKKKSFLAIEKAARNKRIPT